MKTIDVFHRLLTQRLLYTKAVGDTRTREILYECFGECVDVKDNIVTVSCTDATYTFKLVLCDGQLFTHIRAINIIEHA